MKRIAVLVSGGGTNLQALIDAEKDGKIKSGRLTLVISSSPDAYALKRAEMAGIPTAVVPRKDYPDRAEFSKQIETLLLEQKINLTVFAGFNFILSEAFCKKFRNRMINVHPTLIPSFCGDGFYGLKVHERVLEYGVKLTGATVHFVNEITDGGAIILQKAVEVKEGDSPERLQRRVMEQAEWVLLPQAVELFCADRLTISGRVVHIKEQ